MKRSLLLFFCVLVQIANANETPVDKLILGQFLENHCIRCHGADKQKGKIRFDQLDYSISDNGEALQYQDVLDVLNSGEMPPEDEPQPSREEMEMMIGTLTEDLFKARKNLASSGGKVEMRRLNRREYAATIDRLFGFVPAASRIPPDGDVLNFDTVGSRQLFTTEHLEEYYELGQQVLGLLSSGAGKKEPMKTHRQDPEQRWNAMFRRNIKQWEGETGKVVRLSKMRVAYLARPNIETGVYLDEPLRHLTYKFGVDPRATYRISVLSGTEGEVHPTRRFIKVANNEGLAGVFHVTGTSENPTESVAEVRPVALKGDSVVVMCLRIGPGAWLSQYLNSIRHYEGVDPKQEGLIWIDSFKIEGRSIRKREASSTVCSARRALTGQALENGLERFQCRGIDLQILLKKHSAAVFQIHNFLKGSRITSTRNAARAKASRTRWLIPWPWSWLPLALYS